MLLKTLAYAASLVPEIADGPDAVDCAMRLGYNWKAGPFELIDKIGPAWLAAALSKDGENVPKLLSAVGDKTFYRTQDGYLQHFTGSNYEPVPRPDGVLLLQDVKRRSQPIARNMSATLWDIGDGVACLEFTSKMNSLNPLIMFMIEKGAQAKADELGVKLMTAEYPKASATARIPSWLLERPRVATAEYWVRTSSTIDLESDTCVLPQTFRHLLAHA